MAGADPARHHPGDEPDDLPVGGRLLRCHRRREEYHREEEHHQLQPADLAMVGGVFLVFNVPTLVLGGIWLYYKNRREWKEDLKKMNKIFRILLHDNFYVFQFWPLNCK